MERDDDDDLHLNVGARMSSICFPSRAAAQTLRGER